MASVLLAQATDMTTLPTGLSIGNGTRSTNVIVCVPTNLNAAPAFISMTGNFSFGIGGSTDFNPGGAITTAVFDILDTDLVPNIVITGVAFDASGTALMTDINSNMSASVMAFLGGADIFTGSFEGDSILGLAGNDRIFAAGGGDYLEGGAGRDYLDGGSGTDTAAYRNANARVVVDMLDARQNRGEALGDRMVRVEDVFGTPFSDTIRGTNGPNTLSGYTAGNDRVFGRAGNDTIFTAGGLDWLDGGRGRDILNCGSSEDTFDYNAVADSPRGAAFRDTIVDFGPLDDKVDFSTIDASTIQPGNQKFVFIGAQTFVNYHASHPGIWGMVRYSGGVIQANVNNTFAADMEILLSTAPAISAANFVL